MRIRAAISAALAWAITLVLAIPAFAAEGGEGLYGKADDKVITYFGFGLMVFFVLLVTILSTAQYLLEKRKRR